jgi:hypothetical protein
MNHKDLEIINEALSMVDKSRIVLVANNIYALYYIGEGYSVIAGPNLNVANSLSYYHLTSMGVKDVVWSIENNDTSLGIGYEGNAVMMTLAHCPFKTLYANKCSNCSYQKGLKICTPTSEYKVHRYSISQCYFELINDVPYNNIVKILSAPYGSTGIINHIGTIIDKDFAMNLINNHEYTSHGIENSTIYFIPHFFKNSRGPQVWGLGHNIKDIYYINITNPNQNVKKMTIEEIEHILGYKIEIVDEEN